MSQALQQIVGGDSTVRAYYDEREEHVHALVEAVGTPHAELSTYVTASLHASENRLDDRDLRVELFLVGPTGDERVGNLLATAAFCVSKDGWLAAPGVVFSDITTDYFPRAQVKHLMWVPPFDFGDASSICAEGVGFAVHGLQGVPITDAERRLLEENGFGALESVLQRTNAPYYDFARASVV